MIVVSDEFTIIFGTALLVALYYYQDDPVKSFNLGMIIIGVVVCSLLKNISIILYIAVRDSYLKFRAWIHKKLNTPQRKKERLKRELKAERKKHKEEAKQNELIEKYYGKPEQNNSIEEDIKDQPDSACFKLQTPHPYQRLMLDLSSDRSIPNINNRDEIKR